MDLVTGAIGSIISKLAELLKEEYQLLTGVKKKVQSLTDELQHVSAFLQEIDKVPPDQLNKQVKIWASEVREASYDMEDVLDSFLVCTKEDPKPVNKNKLKRLKKKIGILFRKTMARHDIANAIEEVNKKLKEIAERRQRYKIDDRVVSPATPSSSIDPRIALVHGAKASLLIGIDVPKDAVIKMLSEKKANVLSIVGFGGVGKTTLAKATYDQLKHKYEYGAFVSVGRNPDLVKIYKDILYDLDKDEFKEIHSTQRGAEWLVPKLLAFLTNKRYLIVIDDIWEAQSRKRITEALTENNNGSRTIITTRKSEVATGEVYRLQPLSNDNSKTLFYTRIFGGDDKCPDNQRQKVSDAAHKILRKCGGVPLAIIAMASLLVGKSIPEWSEVCNSIGLRDKDKEQLDDTRWILSLSYYDLPSHLKTCLLYLSVFPEDHIIKKDALIWMWIAEGFVKGKPGTGELFEIGEEYFNDLINRSLIQPVEDAKSMVVKGCRVHDMILDLIRSLSREVNFAIVLDSDEDTLLGSNARMLAFQNRVMEDTPQDNQADIPRARSFIAFRCRFGLCVPLRSFKLLRVLFLEGCYLTHFGDLLPKEIGALKFLRMLCLEGNHGSRLLLPSSVGMLTQLVCLRAWHMSLPGGIIKNLTSLQVLHIYPGEDDNSMAEFMEDLGNLRELRALRISTHSLRDRRMQLNLLESLGNLHQLKRLELDGVTFEEKGDGESETTNEWLLQLRLPQGLCQLVLDVLPELPPCIDPSCLRNLSHLTLDVGDLSDQGLKNLGELPELCYLKLSVAELEMNCKRATIIGTAGHGYFQNLTSCLLPHSMVQFVVNEDDSSVSFTIWSGSGSYDGAPAFGSKKKQDNITVAWTVMPRLEVLDFRVDLNALTAKCNNGSCDNLGLERLASLQKVRVHISGWYMPEDVLEKEEGSLRHAIQAHPNKPALEILHDGSDVVAW